ncbi:phage major capsid protein [Neomegalonema sp.]|uniref:phage major capsid protein n=1 Tax=Neomegalonema sp. TaxID=2039713 RepID=UPI00262B00A5|nr:phage major capsid protein [Neomegalonema sp.]MDD2870330.1 phage major capsid protein [Neomegalonema sp.]
MADLNDLRKKRGAKAELMATLADELTALENAEAPEAAAIDAKSRSFEAAQAEFDLLDGQVRRAESAEAARAASAEPAPTNPRAVRAPARAVNEADQGIAAGLFVLAMAATKGDPDRAPRYAEETLGASAVAGELRAALNTGAASAGGVLVPETYSSEIIKLLSARAVIRSAGARVIDMPAGNVRDARQTGGATAAYGAEGAPITVSEPTFGEVAKSFKKLTAMVPVSNDLIRYGSPSVASFVRDDLVQRMALREDLAFLRDNGSGGAPKGLRYWAKAAHVFAAAATTNAATIGQDLRKAVNLLEEANISLVRPGWVMRPSIRNYLAELRNSVGAKVYPEIDAENALLGHPIHRTTQIPGNLGAGTDTEIYFADFWEIVIGDSMSVTISVHDGGAYVDGGGATHSGVQRDFTLIRAISEHDMAPDHDEAISVITGVDWPLAA